MLGLAASHAGPCGLTNTPAFRPSVNFQITILKLLDGYRSGWGTLDEIKRDMAILIKSGREWSDRTKKMADQVPGLDIFFERLVERARGGWQITDRGRAVLRRIEARSQFSSRNDVRPERPDTNE